MATVEEIQATFRSVIEKLDGMLWITEPIDRERVEELAALFKANEPTDWLNIAVIDHMTDFAEDETGGVESSGYAELVRGGQK